MFDYIESLRKKPEKTKKRIAFFTAFSICAVIFIIWFSVNYRDFNKAPESETQVVNKKDESTQSSLIQFFTKGLNDLKEQLNIAKEKISDFNAGAEYYSATSTESQ